MIQPRSSALAILVCIATASCGGAVDMPIESTPIASCRPRAQFVTIENCIVQAPDGTLRLSNTAMNALAKFEQELDVESQASAFPSINVLTDALPEGRLTEDSRGEVTSDLDTPSKEREREEPEHPVLHDLILEIARFYEGGFSSPAIGGRQIAIVLEDASVLITVIYDNGPDYFSQGLVRFISKDGKMGYANDSYEVVIPAVFDWVYPFYEEYAGTTLVCNGCIRNYCGDSLCNSVKGGDWFWIDSRGNVLRRTSEPHD